ncbi:hypothetical protein DFH09DRAFT_1322812 [Mycena vulgaris]|nr:hypothetical protein DFH09DRAFT_1322812 [Mycena vulgaris]
MAPASISIRSLAPEILEEIIAFLPSESHLSLCRVSKLLYALCVRSIYCDVSLRSPATVVKCCRTLARNARAAAAVRSFEISYTPSPSTPPPLPAFYTLLGTALTHMHNIHRLVLLAPDPTMYTAALALARCDLPRLHHFECGLALDATVAAFLNRHPQINYLQLGAQVHTPPYHRVALPKLEYLIAHSAAVAPLLYRASPSLRAAFITWDAADSDSDSDSDAEEGSDEDALAALARTSTDTLNLLSCHRPGRNLALLAHIAARLPHIYALNLIDTNPRSPGVPLVYDPADLQAIGESLALFSSLQRLVITCVGVCAPAPHLAQDEDMDTEMEMNMDSAFDTVTAWGAACPSLLECTPPQSSTRWLRVCDDLWLPAPDGTGTRWLWGRLRSGAYPGWARVGEALRAHVSSSATAKSKSALSEAARLEAAARAREWAADDDDAVRWGRMRIGGAGVSVDTEDG